MNVDKISEILDLAKTARSMGKIFIPMFVGESGIGKTEGIQQWVNAQQKLDPDFQFVDLRLAYYEGPDFIGYPYEYKDDTNTTRMGHALPHFWPTKGKGLLLLEEPNRGNSMIQNCLMQLTDKNRKVGPTYELPDGWLIAAALNPESANYDVNSMDTALKNRFAEFEVEFNFSDFLAYIEKAKWHEKVLNFVKSGVWLYKKPDALGKDGKYISPRTLARMEALESAGASDAPEKRNTHYILCLSILGKHVGNEYWKSCWDDAPITATDILKDKDKALAKLKAMSGTDKYEGDKIDLTVSSIVDKFSGWHAGSKDKDGNVIKASDEDTIDEQTMVDVAMIIPASPAITLIKGCAQKVAKSSMGTYLGDLVKRHPDLQAILRDNIKLGQAMKRK